MGTEAAVGLLLALIDRVAQWSAVVQNARNEGRPVSEAEVDAFVAQAEASDVSLQAAIAKAKAEGR